MSFIYNIGLFTTLYVFPDSVKTNSTYPVVQGFEIKISKFTVSIALDRSRKTALEKWPLGYF